VTLLKGKLWTGVVGIFIPGVALIGAVRLAKPRSPWAHLRYAGNADKLRQARLRDARLAQHKRRLWDLIGGAPSRLPEMASSRLPTPRLPEMAPARVRELAPARVREMAPARVRDAALLERAD